MEEQLPHSTSGSKGTTFLKTCFNGFNALCGLGIITLPYTLAQGGWITLVLLPGVALITCYTALLLQRCMDSNSSIKTYPDIGWHAFGRKGRIIVSIFIYSAAYLVSTGFLISESDNLHKLFPNAGFQLGEHNIRGKQLSTVLAGLAILPTMWLKDLSMLSFISAGGIVAIVIIISSILWVGVVDSVGFSAKGELFRFGGIPTALSLYAFAYGGHGVFPTIYSSMKDKTQFSKVYN
ncbi:amino acid transporter AVT1I-like [Malania oleifera]|uniref:amino acid transporter AVT1I-like n=1 Tax=Malania oleifera TaxID=397392 RepID=UPI0025AE90DD|nr:amino acid transporter AVT1I-like [Malania oleifera]